MNLNKLFLGFLLWLIPFTLSAQRTVSGRVTDAETGDPVVGAAVFIANTTVGATTDASGNYQLKIPGEGSYRLAVSHVAYQPVSRDIEPGKMLQTINVAMQIHEMEEVAITVKTNVRKKDIELFWRTILGQKPSKKTIQATNPEDVYFYYNTETKKLTVTCRVPLNIVNNETGYQIQYVLNHFTHDYNANISSWMGQYLFTELEPENYKQKNAWEKNRDEIYRVSLACLIKSLFHDSTMEHGFLFVWRHSTGVHFGVERITYDVVDSRMFVSIDSITNGKMFYVPPDMNIILINYAKPISDKDMQDIQGAKPFHAIGLFRNRLQTPDEPVHIFSDGSYMNPLLLTPTYSSKRLSGLDMILPIEYSLDEANKAMTLFSENEPTPLDPLADTLIRVAQRFDRQLDLFPQEKIHLQTDKPYYIAGERIWFRAHVVDAATHVPSFSASSVFVELFDARDSVVCRVKTGIGNDLYSGYINIPEDVPEGNYTLRAWTKRMRNLDEDYFYLKNIRIGNPLNCIVHAQPEFEFLTDKKIGVAIRFSPASPISPISPNSPESIKISINNNKPMNLKYENGVSGFNFNLSSAEKQRVMLLDAIYEKKSFRQYIKIPLPDDDFDVSFYPEGGSSLYGIEGRIAFKAMQRDGTEIDVKGTVYESRGNEITQIQTEARGMGQFRMRYDPCEKYYVVCTNSKGQSKRFDLPAAKSDGYALSTSWFRDQLIVKVLQPESKKTDDTLCLIVHTRGVVQDVSIWENTGEPVVFQKDFFPSGVSHLLLLTKEMIPVSERLVFILNDDQAIVTCKTNSDIYTARSPVDDTVTLTDKEGKPLLGNFSVAVTDDHDVSVDTTCNILTTMLFSSDLRGNIPDLGYYFRKKGRTSEYLLDLLMLTQGWRRYDTQRILKNDLMYPDTMLTKGYELSGMVRTSFLRPAANKSVSILSQRGDYSATFTDRHGRFYFQEGAISDSVVFLVQTEQKSGIQNFELILDKPSYPERMIPVVATGAPVREQFAIYADKTEQKYVEEHGMRIYHLSEVVISAPRKKGEDFSFFYKSRDATYTITDEDIERFPPASMNFLLRRFPGIQVDSDNGSVTRGREGVIVTVNDMPVGMSMGMLRDLHPSDIIQIDLVYGPGYIFSNGTTPWLLSVTTRIKKHTPKETPYIKYFMPLGFQKPAEFYTPKYDTPALKSKSDLRTTIHWQPNITTDENGKASFSFYTADAPSTYTVVIEGMTEDGKIVYKRDKIVVND